MLAKHVYNLDLTDLPLDRLSDQKNKRTRRGFSRPESSNVAAGSSESGHATVGRQDSSIPDGQMLTKRGLSVMARSYSETNLAVKRRPIHKQQVKLQIYLVEI